MLLINWTDRISRRRTYM